MDWLHGSYDRIVRDEGVRGTNVGSIGSPLRYSNEAVSV